MNKVRSIKYSLTVLLLFLSAALAITLWMFFSKSGSRFAIDRIQQALPGASYEYVAGNLAHGLSLKNVRWQLKNNATIISNELNLTWDPWCWRSRQVCIKEAQTDTLTINLVEPEVIRNPIVPVSVSLPLELSAGQLHIGKLVINRPDRSSIEINDIDFSGTFEGPTIRAHSLSAQWNTLNATVSGELSLENNYPISAQGSFQTTDQPGGAQYIGEIAMHGDLLQTQVDVSLQSPWISHISGIVSSLDRTLPVDLKATWHNAGLPRQSIDPQFRLTQGQAHLSGTKSNYQIYANADVLIKHLPAAKASIHGQLNRQQLIFTNLSLATLSGEINANGTLDFVEGLSWQSNVNLKDIQPNQYWSVPDSVTSGSLQFNGHHRHGNSRMEFAELDLTGVSGNHPFAINGTVTKASTDEWLLHHIEINSSRNTVKANGRLSEQSDLALDFTLREPGLFKPGLRGDVYGAFTITGNQTQPSINGVARSGQLLYNDLKLTNTAINAAIKKGGIEPGEITFSTDRITLPHTSFDELNLLLRGTRDSHAISAGFKNNVIEIENTRLHGALDAYFNWTGKLNSVQGVIDDNSLQLINTFDLTWINEKQSMAVQPHCWSVNGTYGCIEESALLGKTGAVNFKLNGLDLDTVSALLPDTVSTTGALHSRGRINWSPAQPLTASVSATVIDGALSAQLPAAKQPLNLKINQANLNINTTRGRLKSTLHMITDKTGDIRASVDIDLTKKHYPTTGALNLDRTRLSLLRQYYPDLTIDNGTLSGELLAHGKLTEPDISGLFKIEGADYVSRQLPLPLDSIDVDVSLLNNNFKIDGNAQSDGQPIRLSGNASISEQNWLADFNINADKLKFNHDFVKSAVVSPDLTISLSPQQVTIDGNVWLQDASIVIPKLDNTGVPLSDDIVIIDAAANETSSFVTPRSHAVFADIDVQVGRNVYFDGYGLNAELTGQTNIKLQPKRTPELLGVINVQNGTYRSYGQSLIIRDGNISFVGPIEQTSVSVEAIRSTGSITAGIRIDGTLKDPHTTLFSDPPMPEEHILPYVVLGRPLNFGSSTDDSQLIANAALFMGISNGRGLTQNIAANLGIKDFAMNATGSGDDTQVQLSGRLSERLLIRYGLGVFNSVNTLFLRYDLAEKLYLETTQGLEKAVDVFYSFEFD